MPNKKEGTRCLHHFGPLLDALRALGGSATPDEATYKVAELRRFLSKHPPARVRGKAPKKRNFVSYLPTSN